MNSPAVLAALALTISALAPAAQLPKTPRLYVFNCGTLHFDNADAYSLKKDEVAVTNMSVPRFLITHPKGAMIWDAGIIPDTSFPPSYKAGSAEIKEGIRKSGIKKSVWIRNALLDAVRKAGLNA